MYPADRHDTQFSNNMDGFVTNVCTTETVETVTRNPALPETFLTLFKKF